MIVDFYFKNVKINRWISTISEPTITIPRIGDEIYYDIYELYIVKKVRFINMNHVIVFLEKLENDEDEGIKIN